MDDSTHREKTREAIQNGKLPTRSPDRIRVGPDALVRARYVATQCGGLRWSLSLSSGKRVKPPQLRPCQDARKDSKPHCTNTISTPVASWRGSSSAARTDLGYPAAAGREGLTGEFPRDLRVYRQKW
jgi:hypothetical protein